MCVCVHTYSGLGALHKLGQAVGCNSAIHLCIMVPVMEQVGGLEPVAVSGSELTGVGQDGTAGDDLLRSLVTPCKSHVKADHRQPG